MLAFAFSCCSLCDDDSFLLKYLVPWQQVLKFESIACGNCSTAWLVFSLEEVTNIVVWIGWPDLPQTCGSLINSVKFNCNERIY